MQLSENELLKIIEENPYIYILKATLGSEYLGTVILSLDKDRLDFKVLRSLYISFH